MLYLRHWAMIVTGSSLLCAAAAQAAPFPYSNDFSTSASDFALSTTTTDDWFLSSGALRHEGTQAGTWKAIAEFPDLGGSADAAGDFVLTADFSAAAGNGTGSRTGVQILGNDSFSSGYRIFISTAVSGSNNGVAIYRDGASAMSGGPGTQLRYLKNTPLQFEVTATYFDSNTDNIDDALQLDVILKNTSTDTVLANISYTDYSPLTGDYFGIIDNNANTSTDTRIAWDSFVLVPEPATAMLLVISAGLAGGRRRRVSRG